MHYLSCVTNNNWVQHFLWNLTVYNTAINPAITLIKLLKLSQNVSIQFDDGTYYNIMYMMFGAFLGKLIVIQLVMAFPACIESEISLLIDFIKKQNYCYYWKNRKDQIHWMWRHIWSYILLNFVSLPIWNFQIVCTQHKVTAYHSMNLSLLHISPT